MNWKVDFFFESLHQPLIQENVTRELNADNRKYVNCGRDL